MAITVTSVREPVYLRVYDISDGAARIWSPVLLGKRIEGIWHTGIQLFGVEYFYGGGIVKMKPNDVEHTYSITPFRVHHLGTTSVSQRDFEKYLISIQSNFTRECYDLVKWNCNNFTDHAAGFLLERGIPAYILELPAEITNTFIGKILINFIKMFSDAPAVDSESANHPRQTLLPPNTNRFFKGRRNSCPDSPSRRGTVVTIRAGARNRHSTQDAVASFSAVKKIRAGSGEWRGGCEIEKRGTSRRRSSSASSVVLPEFEQMPVKVRSSLSTIIRGSNDSQTTDRTEKSNGNNHEKPRTRRSSVPTLLFLSVLSEQADSSSTSASSSNQGTPKNKNRPTGIVPLSSTRRPPRPLTTRSEKITARNITDT